LANEEPSGAGGRTYIVCELATAGFFFILSFHSLSLYLCKRVVSSFPLENFTGQKLKKMTYKKVQATSC